MGNQCKYCGTSLIWARQMVLSNMQVPSVGAPAWVISPTARPNPLEAKPHPEGNLVLHKGAPFYHFATEEERTNGTPLYRSHFAVKECADKAREDIADRKRMLAKRKKMNKINAATWGGRP